MTPAGVAPDCFIDLHVIALHATEAQGHIATALQHTAPQIPILQEISPKMTADPDHT